VRYVQTKQVATGYLATGGGTEVTVEQTYSDVLPSLNLAATVRGLHRCARPRPR
jgi:iron complex outermembrane receptor protein